MKFRYSEVKNRFFLPENPASKENEMQKTLCSGIRIKISVISVVLV
jgi:hypothetical protein